jgi:hypothetical protein
MKLIRSEFEMINTAIIDRLVDPLWEKPDDRLCEAERMLFAVWTFAGFTGLEGIERAIMDCQERSEDEQYDYWAELERGLDFFGLKRMFFIKMGMDWILSQTPRRRLKMTHLLGWSYPYFDNKIFRKLVEVGLLDPDKIDRKAIRDELVRKGLIDDPNVKRDPFDR